MKTKRLLIVSFTLALTLLTSCKDDNFIEAQYNPWLKPGILLAHEATDITLTQAKLSCSIDNHGSSEIQKASVDCHFVIWDVSSPYSQENLYSTYQQLVLCLV